MKKIIFTFVLLFSVSSSLFSQAVFESTCGYTIMVYIKPLKIIAPDNCGWGYNYNVRYHYDVVVLGNNKCSKNLYTFQVEIICNENQMNGSYSLPLEIKNSRGNLTTTTNPAIPHNGSLNGYNSPYVHCSQATVDAFKCLKINVIMEGPGLPSQIKPTNPGALPIELISFNATANQNQVDLTWITGSEKNNDFFTIERTVDGIDFEEVGKVSGQGNSSIQNEYSFTDFRPKNGVSYYRLKQTDYNGESEYFEVKSVHIENGEFVSNVYPNPAVMNRTTVFIEKTSSIVTLNVRNVLGQLISSKEIDATSNDVTEEVELIGSGKLFFIEIVQGNAIVARHKVLNN